MKMLIFGADWCPACNALKPLVAKVMVDFPNVEVQYLDIDDPDDQSVALPYNIRAIPVTLVLDGDMEKARLVGSGSEADFRNFVETFAPQPVVVVQ